MTHHELIGILAGMGPKSTAPFVDMVVDECQRQYGAQHMIDFPPMLIYSLPVPLFIDRPVDHEVVEATIGGGLERLEASGSAFVAMPCNTAHLFHERLAASIGVPLLNMIDQAIATVPRETSRVALLGTSFTVDSGLYQDGLWSLGKTVVHDDARQARVDDLIWQIQSSTDLAEARRAWAALVDGLENDAVDTVVLACTDLNPVADFTDPRLTFVDATRALAAAVVRRWRLGSSVARAVANSKPMPRRETQGTDGATEGSLTTKTLESAKTPKTTKTLESAKTPKTTKTLESAKTPKTTKTAETTETAAT